MKQEFHGINKMALSETRIVLFEKDGFANNFHDLLDVIESFINNSKRNDNKFVYISKDWVKHKLVRKILEENRYKINSLSATCSMYTDTEVSITWN